VISRDAPVGAPDTYPSYRHRFGGAALIYALNQLLIRRLRVVHNNLMFDHVVHINTDGIRAAYGELPAGGGRAADSRKRVVDHIDSGRPISLERWLSTLSSQ